MRTLLSVSLRGHVCTEDPEHVAKAVRAIKERRLREVRVAFSEPGKVVQMRRRGNG